MITRRLTREDSRNLLASLVPILPAYLIFLAVDTPDDRLTGCVLYVLTYWTLQPEGQSSC